MRHQLRGRVMLCGLRTVWLVVLLSCVLAACAGLPSQSKVKGFGQATSSAADVLKKAIDLNSDLAQREGEDRDAQTFLERGEFDLPTKDAIKLSDEVLKPRAELIAAIGKYGDSLATAADRGTTQDIQASATALASTVGQDISPVIGFAAIPIVSPAAKLVGWGVGLAVANTEAVEVQEAMRRTHPILIRASNELKASLAIIVKNDQSHFDDWITQRSILLKKIQRSGDSGAALAEFRVAAAQARDYETRKAAVSKYASLLDAMLKAHEGLIGPTENSDADLTDFLFLVQQVAGTLSALKPSW